MSPPTRFNPLKSGKYPIYLGDSINAESAGDQPSYATVKYNYKPRKTGSNRRIRIKSLPPGSGRPGLDPEEQNLSSLLSLTIREESGSAPVRYTGRSKKAGHVLIFDPARKAFVLESTARTTFNMPSNTTVAYPHLSLESSESENEEGSFEDIPAPVEEDDLEESPYDFRKWLPEGAEENKRENDAEDEMDGDVSEMEERIVERPERVENALGISTVDESDDHDDENAIGANTQGRDDEEDDYLVIDEGDSKPKSGIGRFRSGGLSTPAASHWSSAESDADGEGGDSDAEDIEVPEPAATAQPTRDDPTTPPDDLATELENELADALTPGVDINDEDLEATLEMEMRQAEEEEWRKQRRRMEAEEESEEE
ncbi:MAG: hypothetical protein M1814_002617 [Vezdaea aestivalis]|nr:MAG: hypothetical protein M1814_002617 [Vezdaea aestivalis]